MTKELPIDMRSCLCRRNLPHRPLPVQTEGAVGVVVEVLGVAGEEEEMRGQTRRVHRQLS